MNTTLNNASSIDNEKVQAILSESLPLSEPSPLLPEGKFIYFNYLKVIIIFFTVQLNFIYKIAL